MAIILEAGLTIAFTADQLEKRHAIFSVVENFRCLTDIQALKFNSLFLLAICYLVLCCFPRSTRNSAEPVKRLWRTLVHQESIKELFIQNIFKREMASTEEVSPFLISLLFPISFSFSSFLPFFFPPSFLLLSLSFPSSLPFPIFLFPSSLLLLSYPSILSSPLLIPCLLSVLTLLFSFLLCFFFPIFFSLRASFSAIFFPSLLIPPVFPLSLAVFCMSRFADMRETGSLLCRIVTWDYFGGEILNQFPAQPRNSQ